MSIATFQEPTSATTAITTTSVDDSVPSFNVDNIIIDDVNDDNGVPPEFKNLPTNSTGAVDVWDDTPVVASKPVAATLDPKDTPTSRVLVRWPVDFKQALMLEAAAIAGSRFYIDVDSNGKFINFVGVYAFKCSQNEYMKTYKPLGLTFSYWKGDMKAHVDLSWSGSEKVGGAIDRCRSILYAKRNDEASIRDRAFMASSLYFDKDRCTFKRKELTEASKPIVEPVVETVVQEEFNKGDDNPFDDGTDVIPFEVEAVEPKPVVVPVSEKFIILHWNDTEKMYVQTVMQEEHLENEGLVKPITGEYRAIEDYEYYKLKNTNKNRGKAVKNLRKMNRLAKY